MVQYWAMTFLLTAAAAGFVGFAHAELAAAGFARLIFFLLLFLFVITLGTHLAHSG